MRLLLVLAAFLAVGFQKASTITIDLRAPKQTAIERTKAALIGNGFAIYDAGGDGSALRTAPYRYENAIRFTVRANTIGSDSSSRVVLSGTWAMPELNIHDQPVTPASFGIKKALWAMLSAVADSVRVPAPR